MSDAPGELRWDATRRVQAAIHAAGLRNAVRELDVPMKTAEAAAAAVGCTVGQIVKSIRRRRAGGGPLLVATRGANRVSFEAVSLIVNDEVSMAEPRLVRAVTGFAVGGVPPLGYPAPIEALVDRDLMAHEVLWAAAGHPYSLFPLTPAELVTLTTGRVVGVS
jgi:prolyl-tRNA editing enzyme YbaK/EbsC (Cys-tRNA(Pro) deacylase)